jgi:hypothetical protein
MVSEERRREWTRWVAIAEANLDKLSEWERGLVSSCAYRVRNRIDLSFHQSKSLRSIARRLNG